MTHLGLGIYWGIRLLYKGDTGMIGDGNAEMDYRNIVGMKTIDRR